MIFKKRPSLGFVAFMQVTVLMLYVGVVSTLISRADTLFDPKLFALYSPIFGMTLFLTSALVSALLVLAYPILLFWDKKRVGEALKLLVYSTLWLALYTLLIIVGLFLY